MTVFTMLIFFEGAATAVLNCNGFMRSEAEGTILSVASCGLPPEGLLEAPAKRVRFSTMVFIQSSRFFEAGRVDFPEIDSYLTFEATHSGNIIERPNGESSGSISSVITGGGGRFEGCSGVVTGNFTAHSDGRFFDHQLYKVVLKN